MGRKWLIAGCIFGFLTVALGAFAGHALEHILEAKKLGWIHTANTYLAYHAFALLILGLWSQGRENSKPFVPGLFFIIGIFLFSGSLYALALLQLDFAKYVTPFGGMSFLIGWVSFGISLVRSR